MSTKDIEATLATQSPTTPVETVTPTAQPQVTLTLNTEPPLDVDAIRDKVTAEILNARLSWMIDPPPTDSEAFIRANATTPLLLEALQGTNVHTVTTVGGAFAGFHFYIQDGLLEDAPSVYVTAEDQDNAVFVRQLMALSTWLGTNLKRG